MLTLTMLVSQPSTFILRGQKDRIKLTTLKIGLFIETQLYKIFNRHSSQIFLVYTGKQLDVSKTFKDELVEDQSELMCVDFDQSECQFHQPIRNKIYKNTDRADNPEIQLGPGTNQKPKKPPQPNSQPSAPPNVQTKINNPKEIKEHEQKIQLNQQQASTAPKEEQAPHKLSSGNNSIYNNQRKSNIEQQKYETNPNSRLIQNTRSLQPYVVNDQAKANLLRSQISPIMYNGTPENNIAQHKQTTYKDNFQDKLQELKDTTKFQIKNEALVINRLSQDGKENLFEHQNRKQINLQQKQNERNTYKRHQQPQQYSQYNFNTQNYQRQNILTLAQVQSSNQRNQTQNSQASAQKKLYFQAGDLIYSGNMRLPQTQNLMQNIIKDFSQLLSKTNQNFNKQFGIQSHGLMDK